MKISLDKAWASPSTLHLRLVVSVGSAGHILFREVHIPLRDVDGLVSMETEASEGAASLDQPLPGLG